MLPNRVDWRGERGGMRQHWCGVRGKELHLIIYTNIALLLSGTQMSTSTDNIDDNIACIISPAGTHDNAGAVHQDLAAHLLFNDATPDIPSQHNVPLHVNLPLILLILMSLLPVAQCQMCRCTRYWQSTG
jgi:hypothetical protein